MAIFSGLCLMTLAIACSTTGPPPHRDGPRPYRALGKWYVPLDQAADFVQSGQASWYGGKFHGRPTASGEIYNQHDLTAAHKTLPLGTRVKVINRRNNKSLVVKINDRGPFVKGRIIDLSYAAARRLDIIRAGTAPVTIFTLDDTPDLPDRAEPARQEWFTLQVGAFRQRANAEQLTKKLARTYDQVHMQVYHTDGVPFYRVRVGKFANRRSIAPVRRRLIRDGFDNLALIRQTSGDQSRFRDLKAP